MVVPVKGKVMVLVVVAPVIKALVARVLVVARPPRQHPPQKTGTGTQTLETEALLVTVGKPSPNSHSRRQSRNQSQSLSSSPNSHSRRQSRNQSQSLSSSPNSPAIGNRRKLVVVDHPRSDLLELAYQNQSQ